MARNRSEVRHCFYCKKDTEHRFKHGSSDAWRCVECLMRSWTGPWEAGVCKVHGSTRVRQKYNKRGQRIGWERACCKSAMQARKNREKKSELVSMLGGSCTVCGYSKYAGALEFHHMDPSRKERASLYRGPMSKVISELAKCVLLCANCHREVHGGMHPEHLVSR